VPSSHDAKSAAIVAKLHLDGLTSPWVPKTVHERDIAAAFETVELYKSDLQPYVSRLEAKLARYWPEITGYVSLTSATLLTLLETFGSPQNIASNSKQAHQMMAKIAGHFLSVDKQEAIIRSAAQTIGVSMLKSECKVVQGLAAEMQRLRRLISKAEVELKKATQDDQPVSHIGKVVGVISASAIFVLLGDPAQYETAKAYAKAFGLNLVIHQSGKHIGELKISKRGPGRARHYLYYATLRLIQQNALFKAWYSKKIRRLGEKMKGKAIVALMRKLAQSLWHVGRGSTFDSSKLLDARRLKLEVG
jgi:transposase